jgi:hypothetical protein
MIQPQGQLSLSIQFHLFLEFQIRQLPHKRLSNFEQTIDTSVIDSNNFTFPHNVCIVAGCLRY